ncbi:hypothetical protein BJ122_107101 [Rhodopseudomonas faecalis]|uniref:Uncharacterized protein n=1 Tax=Rhodopseudomonas faecalis TaxID=99655 RepID=A0A318THJ0_9BRAD|nr:hypothetical protein BJ122_107101 [Rhodopseudomonas faecalis]
MPARFAVVRLCEPCDMTETRSGAAERCFACWTYERA